VLVTVDANTVNVEFKRVEYDVDKAANAILESTLPREFAAYLRSGGKSLVAA
jgi:hypothetical protein